MAEKELNKSIQAATGDFLAHLRERVGAEQVEKLPLLFASRLPVDYEEFAEAFAVHYLWPNAKKVQVAIESSFSFGRSVVDLGSGPGSAILGAILAAPHANLVPDRVVLIDRSHKQLSLALELLQCLRRAAGVEIEVEPLQIDLNVLDAETVAVGSDLVVASHVLGEMPDSGVALTSELASRLPGYSQLVVVEQDDDPYWASSVDRASFAAKGLQLSEDAVSLDIPGELSPFLRKGRWNSRWAAIREAPEIWMANLVGDYFRAWNDRDTDLISRLFSEDAVYEDRPFNRSILGRREICDYWNDRVRDVQERVDAHPTRIAYESTAAWIRFSASFLRGGEQTNLEGFMIMEFDLQTRQVSRLQEIYRTSRHS